MNLSTWQTSAGDMGDWASHFIRDGSQIQEFKSNLKVTSTSSW